MNDQPPSLICADPARRRAVRAAGLNGREYLEVSDDQRTLTVYCLGKAPEQFGPANVRIDGGRRVKNIAVTAVQVVRAADPGRDDYVRVTVDRPGDFSTYTLRLVKSGPHGRPGERPFDHAEGFDPRYTRLPLSFKVNCPSDLDCAPVAACPP
ncbi:MAG: putative baseplate assembly protein, partial [Thermomicrobiales bacterium]